MMEVADENVADEAASHRSPQPRGQFLAGVGCICFVAVVWTLATVLKQVIFLDLAFDEPLILAYVCNLCYGVHLPLHVLARSCGLVAPIPWRKPDANPGESSKDVGEVRHAAFVGLLISPLWFLSQWTYSRGVASTSVTSSTVISTTSVVWTLLASVIFLGERLSLLKLLGIAACMAGNVATLWGNDSQGGHSSEFQGDVLCVIAAMLYAAYTTVLTILVRPSTSVSLLFGFLGLAVLIVGTPLVFIFDRGSLGRMTPEVFGLLIFNGLFDNVLSQFAWAKAVQWTSPTAATVGLSLTIPLSVVADLLRHNKLSRWSFVSAFLVVLGFVAVTIASKPNQEHSGDMERVPSVDLCGEEGDHRAARQPGLPSSSAA
mmetsp:Transcript_36530/g.58932  ORF Transcript_36530/g.58932 Transcript_36530/m.58932 type:complete len:374 (+) Transcript_36530:137-1258(+)